MSTATMTPPQSIIDHVDLLISAFIPLEREEGKTVFRSMCYDLYRLGTLDGGIGVIQKNITKLEEKLHEQHQK